MNNKKILILGSNGFIGKNIKNIFINRNGLNFFYLERKEVDFLNKEKLNIYFKDCSPDIVVNCSGIVGSSEKNKKSNEFEIFHTNLILNMNILSCCKENFVKKLITFSSYRTFSNSIPENYNESSLTYDINFNNNIGYLSSKIVNDIQHKILKTTYNLKIICYILPNIFGKFDYFSNDGRIVPSLISKFVFAKKNNEDVIVNSHPETEINLIYVEDVVDIIYSSINNDVVDGNIIVFNKKGTINLKTLCEIIKKKFFFTKKILFSVMNKENLNLNTNIMKPNIEKFETLFQSFCFRDIEMALNETIDHYILTTGIS